jgi:hypothetical protein
MPPPLPLLAPSAFAVGGTPAAPDTSMLPVPVIEAQISITPTPTLCPTRFAPWSAWLSYCAVLADVTAIAVPCAPPSTVTSVGVPEQVPVPLESVALVGAAVAP